MYMSSETVDYVDGLNLLPNHLGELVVHISYPTRSMCIDRSVCLRAYMINYQ